MTKISGQFCLRVVNAATGEVTKERKFKNLITNAGLEQFAKGSTNAVTIGVGTGTNAPAVTDTSLGNQIASASTGFSKISSNADQYYSFRATAWVRFAAGAINNTISEVGVFTATGGALWSRQLIIDEYGDPSTITVLPNEYLDVTYTLNVFPNLEDVPFSFEMNGVTYNCVSRHARGAAINTNATLTLSFPEVVLQTAYATQTLGDITTVPSGTSMSGTTISVYLAWDASAPYSRKFNITLEQNSWNVAGGIGSILLGYRNVAAFSRQINFDPVLPKTNTSVITLTFSDTISRHDS